MIVCRRQVSVHETFHFLNTVISTGADHRGADDLLSGETLWLLFSLVISTLSKV